MNAEHFVLRQLVVDYGSQRQVIKHVIDFAEHAAWTVYVFPQPSGTFFSKAQILVNISILMVPSEQEYLFGESQLKSHQKTNCFQVVSASVHIVA